MKHICLENISFNKFIQKLWII